MRWDILWGRIGVILGSCSLGKVGGVIRVIGIGERFGWCWKDGMCRVVWCPCGYVRLSTVHDNARCTVASK